MKIIRFLTLVFLVTIISVFSGFVLSSSAEQGYYSDNPPKIKLENFKKLPEQVNNFKILYFADIA